MPDNNSDSIGAISELSLNTHEECGGYIAAITGSGVDLLAQGSTREEALERLAMQGAAELAHLAMKAAKPSTLSSGCVWLDLERPCQTEGCTICRPFTPLPFGQQFIDEEALGRWREVSGHDFSANNNTVSRLVATIDYLRSPSTPIDDEGLVEKDEIGWLIEEHAGGFIHWVALAKGQWPRTTRSTHPYVSDRYQTPILRVKDANEALRFARQDDAEAFMELFEHYLLDAKAIEHCWPSNVS